MRWNLVFIELAGESRGEGNSVFLQRGAQVYGPERLAGLGKDVLEVVVARGLGGETEKRNWLAVNHVEAQNEGDGADRHWQETGEAADEGCTRQVAGGTFLLLFPSQNRIFRDFYIHSFFSATLIAYPRRLSHFGVV